MGQGKDRTVALNILEFRTKNSHTGQTNKQILIQVLPNFLDSSTLPLSSSVPKIQHVVELGNKKLRRSKYV